MSTRLVRMLALVVLAGCHGRTELVVGVATDLRARGEIDQVTLLESRNDIPLFQHDWTLSDVPAGQYELPGSFGFYTSDGSEPLIELTVQGYLNGQKVAERTSILSLVADQTLFLRMGITAACNPKLGVTCAADETCVEGVCEPRRIDAHVLPAFKPELVKNVQCESRAKYIVSSTGVAMPSLESGCDSTELCHEGTCHKKPTATTGGGGFDLGGFCVPADGGTLDDGGVSVVSNTDLRFTEPVEVALFCGAHFYPYEYTLNAGDGLAFTAYDGGSHHLTSSLFNSPDLKQGEFSYVFMTPGDYVVQCMEHPNAGTLTVHVVQ